jgi:arylsulfatase A-like enzyme
MRSIVAGLHKAVVLFFVFVFCFTFISHAEAGKKRNVLFIITDHQRFDALSIAGNQVLKTPNLDRLAKQGAWFKNAYAQCTVCGPSPASILTGCTVENHGILTNSLAESGTKQSATIMPQKTFDQILSENEGYHCEYYGKWHTPEFAASCYKNPVKNAVSGRLILGSSGNVRFCKDNYLNQAYPKPLLKSGELYDTFSERPYVPNILDKYFEMTQKQVNNSPVAGQGCQPDKKVHTESIYKRHRNYQSIYYSQANYGRRHAGTCIG